MLLEYLSSLFSHRQTAGSNSGETSKGFSLRDALRSTTVTVTNMYCGRAPHLPIGPQKTRMLKKKLTEMCDDIVRRKKVFSPNVLRQFKTDMHIFSLAP